MIIDRLHVWRAQDFPINPETDKHEIDYTGGAGTRRDPLHLPLDHQVLHRPVELHRHLAAVAPEVLPDIRVIEETATEKTNWERAEKFKNALNLGWVHAFRDTWLMMAPECSLLELECKFLSERNGKVYKQEFGPVNTKDLYDAVRWWSPTCCIPPWSAGIQGG